MPARMPFAVASISTTALSVSTSSSGSPLVMASPSFFNQAMILPVSCAISSAGITTLVAISSAEFPRSFEDGLFGGHGRIFQWRGEWNGNVHRAHSLYRRFQIKESAFGNYRCDFGGHAISSITFVNNDGARRFLCRLDESLFVERPNGARIDNLRADV